VTNFITANSSWLMAIAYFIQRFSFLPNHCRARAFRQSD